MAITKIQSESLNLADDYAFTGTITGAGGTMTPAFMATNVSGQSIGDNVLTKVTLTSERLDTDNCYDNSTNYRFTPTTAGKYYCFGNISFNSGADANILELAISLYKNGAYSTYDYRDIRSNPASYTNYLNTVSIIDFNGTSDYVELYALANISSGSMNLDGSSSIDYARFGAFKIIE